MAGGAGVESVATDQPGEAALAAEVDEDGSRVPGHAGDGVVVGAHDLADLRPGRYDGQRAVDLLRRGAGEAGEVRRELVEGGDVADEDLRAAAAAQRFH